MLPNVGLWAIKGFGNFYFRARGVDPPKPNEHRGDKLDGAETLCS